MSEIKSRADLLEAAAKMMRMCDEAGIPCCAKYKGEMRYLDDLDLQGLEPTKFEPFLAIVEGKPVFKGDELYHENFGKVTIRGESGTFLKITIEQKGSAYNPKTFSWLPPKPRTVMVELLREDAEYYAAYHGGSQSYADKLGEACRKALEEK